MSVAELLAILQRVMQFAEGPNYLVLVQDEDDEGCPITDCQVELVNKAVILNVNTRAPTAGLPAPGPLPEAPVSIVRRIGDVEECYQRNQECWDFLYIPTLSLPAMA
jgi:hypothetical protein